MEIIPIVTHHFIKSEDLNHHGTLFAGRSAEWFVEAGLMAAAVYLPPENIVCVKIHGMDFKHPAKLGETAKLVSKVVDTGKTSMVANVCLHIRDVEILNGFITFVNVDSDGKPFAHNIEIHAEDLEDIALQNYAKTLNSKG